jgi:hypothetical protein
MEAQGDPVASSSLFGAELPEQAMWAQQHASSGTNDGLTVSGILAIAHSCHRPQPAPIFRL